MRKGFYTGASNVTDYDNPVVWFKSDFVWDIMLFISGPAPLLSHGTMKFDQN